MQGGKQHGCDDPTPALIDESGLSLLASWLWGKPVPLSFSFSLRSKGSASHRRRFVLSIARYARAPSTDTLTTDTVSSPPERARLSTGSTRDFAS